MSLNTGHLKRPSQRRRKGRESKKPVRHKGISRCTTRPGRERGKRLKQYLEKGPTEWKDTLRARTEGLAIATVGTAPKAIHMFSAVSGKTQGPFLTDMGTEILLVKTQGTATDFQSQNTAEKEEQSWRIPTPNLKSNALFSQEVLGLHYAL